MVGVGLGEGRAGGERVVGGRAIASFSLGQVSMWTSVEEALLVYVFDTGPVFPGYRCKILRTLYYYGLQTSSISELLARLPRLHEGDGGCFDKQ